MFGRRADGSVRQNEPDEQGFGSAGSQSRERTRGAPTGVIMGPADGQAQALSIPETTDWRLPCSS